MDTYYLPFALPLLAAIALLAAIIKSRRRKVPQTLEMVQRRRMLNKVLKKLVPNESEAARLLSEEAMRLKVRTGSVEALEATVKRLAKAREPLTPKTRRRAA